MSLLTPDSGLLFWMILSFGIVLVILSKYGFPVIIKALELQNLSMENAVTDEEILELEENLAIK